MDCEVNPYKPTLRTDEFDAPAETFNLNAFRPSSITVRLIEHAFNTSPITLTKHDRVLIEYLGSIPINAACTMEITRRGGKTAVYLKWTLAPQTNFAGTVLHLNISPRVAEVLKGL